ncbi:MAG: hypothetical protein A3K18_23985 [Lentisphaerae bacterium RIFOXYA12_64_32]|nr:MAG: hypothetical protein A3K18_23985 [Lentisphaerae bacterium RIFOXYA12_64_32]
MQSKPGTGFDSASFKPNRAPAAMVFDRGPSETQARFALIKEDSPEAELLTVTEKRLWDLMDGRRTVDDVCLAYLAQHESLALSQVYALLRRLWSKGLILDNPGFGDVTATKRGRFVLRSVVTRSMGVRIPGTGAIARCAQRLTAAPWLESGLVATVAAIVVLVGLALAPSLQSRSLWQWNLPIEFPVIGIVPESYVYGLVLLVLLNLLCSLAREMFLAALEGSYTGRFDDLRFGVFPWVPSFHHVRKWRPTLAARRRVVAGAAPLVFELLCASVCVFLLRLGPAPLAAEILFKLMAVFYLRTFMHLGPFPGSDLPTVLNEWSGIVDINIRALGFLRYSFAESFLSRTKRTREHWFFLAYILGSVAWLVTFAGVATKLIPDDFAVATLIGEGSGMGLVMLVLFLIPIVLAISLTIAWVLFFLWRFLAYHPLFQNPNNVLCIAALGLCAVVVAIQLAPLRRQPVLLSAASAAMMLAGAGLAYRFIFRTRVSTLGTQLASVGLALLCGGIGMLNGALWQNLNLSLVAEIWLFLFLVPPLVISFNRQQHVVVADENDFRFPYLMAVGGFVLLALVNAGNFAFVNIENPAMKAMPLNSLLAYSLIPLALITFHLHLKSVTSTAPILILSNLKASEPQALSETVAAVRQNIRAMLVAKFGESCVKLLEMQGEPRLGTVAPPPFPVLEPDESVEDLRRELRMQLTDIDGALSYYFGREFSDLVFGRALSTVNYEAQVLLQRLVLRGTRFGWPIPDDRTLDARRCAELLNAIGFFRILSEEDRIFLAQHMTLEHYPTHAKLIRRGERADVCFIVVDGDVQVEETDLCGERRIIAFMGHGDFFGESALLDGGRRVANVRATAPTLALALYRRDFQALGAKHPDMVAKVTEQMRTLHFLFTVRLFADLPTRMLRAAVPRFTLRTYETEETVFRKGEKGDALYIIQSGAVAVIDEINGQEQKVRSLGIHDYFGEIALLRDVPRTMTVRATERTQLLVLDQNAMRQLLRNSQLFATNIERVSEERLHHV